MNDAITAVWLESLVESCNRDGEELHLNYIFDVHPPGSPEPLLVASDGEEHPGCISVQDVIDEAEARYPGVSHAELAVFVKRVGQTLELQVVVWEKGKPLIKRLEEERRHSAEQAVADNLRASGIDMESLFRDTEE